MCRTRTEINYQKNLWQKHYEGAVENAGQVLAALTDSSLHGYRALWNYLAGAAAAYEAAGAAGMSARARTHFDAARDAAGAIRWLASLARYRAELLAVSTENLALQGQIERLEATLLKLGTKHEARFAQKEKAILDGLNSADTTQFETAHKDLGEMLGFDLTQAAMNRMRRPTLGGRPANIVWCSRIIQGPTRNRRSGPTRRARRMDIRNG
jgi:hypothetical protein